MSLADIKRDARTALHDAMAVPASYLGPEEDAEPVDITVRWHNKLARAGNLQGGYDAEIIEGIERLIFNQDNLTAAGVTLAHRGVVTIADYGAAFSLDTEEPSDGPLNVYWVVVRTQ